VRAAAAERGRGTAVAWLDAGTHVLIDARLRGGQFGAGVGNRFGYGWVHLRRNRIGCRNRSYRRRRGGSGGILRRGLAISQARVAVVTNVSADHFGEYGIDDLAGLADVKLTVAGVLSAEGLLVLNADDAQLVATSDTLARRFGRAPPLGWFALDADHPQLRAHRLDGGATCGVRDGRLRQPPGPASSCGSGPWACPQGSTSGSSS